MHREDSQISMKLFRGTAYCSVSFLSRVKDCLLDNVVFLFLRLIPPTNQYNETMEVVSQIVGISSVNGKQVFSLSFVSFSFVAIGVFLHDFFTHQ